MTTRTEHDAEQLGRLVRETWVEYAREQPDPKPGHLLPWEELDEGNKEVDRRIGLRVAAFVSTPLADEVEGLRERVRVLETGLKGYYEIKDEYSGGDFDADPPVDMVQTWQVRHYKPIMMGTPINRHGYKTREEAEAALADVLAATGRDDTGGGGTT